MINRIKRENWIKSKIVRQEQLFGKSLLVKTNFLKVLLLENLKILKSQMSQI